MEKITEEMGIHKEWYEDAKKVTLESLPAFLRRLLEDYGHDYGTICHAIAAGVVATGYAMNRHEAAGITGFQAGAIMWEFMGHWNGIKGPAKLLEFENMLFPQYEERFSKIISKETAKWLKEKAEEKLKEFELEPDYVNPDVFEHMKKVAGGWIPFGYSVED